MWRSRSVGLTEASVRAGEGHLVGLGEVEHDVGDGPTLTARGTLPVGVAQRCHQCRQLGVLLCQGVDDLVHRGTLTARTAGTAGTAGTAPAARLRQRRTTEGPPRGLEPHTRSG